MLLLICRIQKIVKEENSMRKLAFLLLAFFTFALILPANSAEARMCFRCDGKGYIEAYEYDSHTPNYSGSNNRRGYNVRKTCPSCNGRGYKD